MPERLVARLTAELDAVTPASPRPAQARYRRAAAPAPWPHGRLGGLALSAAACAVAVAALATLSTGSPNPEVWTGHLAAGIHRLQDLGGPGGSAAPQTTPPVVGAPAPDRSGNGERAAGSPDAQQPGSGNGHQPSAAPTSRGQDRGHDSPHPAPTSSSGRNEHATSDSGPGGR